MLFFKNRGVPRKISQCLLFLERPIKIKSLKLPWGLFSFRPWFGFGFGKPHHD